MIRRSGLGRSTAAALDASKAAAIPGVKSRRVDPEIDGRQYTRVTDESPSITMRIHGWSESDEWSEGDRRVNP